MYTSRKEEDLTFEHARVFDGINTIDEATVIVRDGLIAAIGRDGLASQDATVFEARGMTILPGLMDAHFHSLGEPEALRQATALGVTTVLDMGCAGKDLNHLKAASAQNADLAEVYGATHPAVAGDAVLKKIPGLEEMPTIDRPEEAASWVDARIAEGSDFVKVIYDAREGGSLTEDTVSAIISAAHSRGKHVWVHALDEGNARRAVMAGADGLAHLFVGDSAGNDFGELLSEHRVSVVPTLVVLLNTFVGDSQIQSFLTDERLKPFINVKTLHPWPSRPRPNLYEGTREAMKRMIAAKVPILAGTDAAPPITGIPWGASLHRELELLVKEGMSPAQALAAATSTTAMAFNLRDRGSIRPGLRADLLLVKGDPTSKIDSTRNIVGIWKAGRRVRRMDTLTEEPERG